MIKTLEQGGSRNLGKKICDYSNNYEKERGN